MHRSPDRDLSPWYAPEHLPAVNMRCWSWWSVHGVPQLLLTARIWVGRAWQWSAVTKRGAIMRIPPAGREGMAWSDGPTCWQPVDASVWAWPGGEAPPPLAPHLLPRMTSIGMSFTETDDAAGDADVSGHAIDDDLPWWRDVTAICYQPMGEVARDMAEGRIMRALADSGSLRPRLHTPTTMGILARLADEKQAIEDARDDERVAAAITLRFEPQQQDRTDFDTAMGWFADLYPVEERGPNWRMWSISRRQRVLWLRSLDTNLSWQDVAEEITPRAARERGKVLSYQRAQQIYDATIDDVWRIANGMRRAA